MKYIFSAIGVCLLFLGCQIRSQQDHSRYLKPGFNYVQQIPDSLRTPEQKELVKQLLKMSIEQVQVANNHMVFTMSKDQFLKTGVPAKYYRLFKKSMRDNNKFIKENNINNVDEKLQRYRHKIRKVLKEKCNAPADTTYFELQTAMIQKAWVEKVALPRGDRYRVNVQLKDRYRDNYARATEKSIGKILALTYHGDILTSPTVHTKITSGRTTIGIFKNRDQAEKIKQRILGKGEW